nr:MAG TPA: hypothetical protein [Caudoviricetes sp.]
MGSTPTISPTVLYIFIIKGGTSMKLRCPQAQQKLPTLNVFTRLLY